MIHTTCKSNNNNKITEFSRETSQDQTTANDRASAAPPLEAPTLSVRSVEREERTKSCKLRWSVGNCKSYDTI